MNTTLIALAIALLLPAILGWCVLIRSLLRAYADRCERAVVRDGKRHVTPIQRARARRDWDAKHANAKVVTLTRDGPKAAA